MPLFGVFRHPIAKLLVFVAVAIGCLVAIGFAVLEGDRERMIVRVTVFGGALASMVLHEYSHGVVAYFGGDESVKSRGFLTLNPLKFMDPVFSIAMPMLFVLLGGIPLMGGRTLIDHSRLRSRGWESAVSLAGPGANLIEAFILAALLREGIIDANSSLGAGVAYLIVIELAGVIFNLIPIPPLDGFGVIAPHLSEQTRMAARSLGMLPYFLVLAALWTVPGAGQAIWDQAYRVADALQVSPYAQYVGYNLSRLR